METTKQILLDIAKRLDTSTATTWNRGDIEQWSDHATRMKNTIASVTPILKTIAGGEESISTKTSKKEQKIVMSNSQSEINYLIDKGWKVISINPSAESGEFCFLLER